MTTPATPFAVTPAPDRGISIGDLRNSKVLDAVALTPDMIVRGVRYAYDVLDTIDAALLFKGENRLSLVVESTNLSAMVGNLLRSGIAKASNGLFLANGPHKYPDLLHQQSPKKHVEIKMAGRSRRPKGHLAKPGYHLTARYVMCGVKGESWRGKKHEQRRKSEGVLLYIWELRFGYLREEHFKKSSTEGDSGKTATVTAAGMQELVPIYFDTTRCPLCPGRSAFKELDRVCASCH